MLKKYLHLRKIIVCYHPFFSSHTRARTNDRFLSYYQHAKCLQKQKNFSQASQQCFFGNVDSKVWLKIAEDARSRMEFERDSFSLFHGTYFRVDEREKSSQSTIMAISRAGWVGTTRDSIFRTIPGHRLISSLFTTMPEDATRKLKREDVDP